MKRSMIKIFSLILIAVMLVSVSNVSFAFDTQGHTDEQIKGMQGPGNSGSSGGLVGSVTANTSGTTANRVKGISGIIVGILQVIGVAAAIIMLVFLGIKYVSAAPSEKADIKKSAAIYVVGAVMLLGASVILGWIEGFINDDLSKVGVKPTEEYIHLA